MASQAPTMLPLLYNGLEPLNRNVHGNFKVRKVGGLDRVAKAHAIPLTVDEFALAQRHYPIVFSAGENPVPLALMGLHEGTNTFFGKDGTLIDQNVLHPGLSAPLSVRPRRLRDDSDELSLCFDPTATRLAKWTRASRCSTATSRPTRPRRSSSSASSSNRPANAPRRSWPS